MLSEKRNEIRIYKYISSVLFYSIVCIKPLSIQIVGYFLFLNLHKKRTWMLDFCPSEFQGLPQPYTENGTECIHVWRVL